VALSTFATGANAALVESPQGDPFPAGSFVILTPSSPFSTPFGSVAEIVLSDFNLLGTTTGDFDGQGDGTDFRYVYTQVKFSNDFLDGSGNVSGSYVGDIDFDASDFISGDPTGFLVYVYDRPNAGTAGEFVAEIALATFEGDVIDSGSNNRGSMTTRINPGSGLETVGTATFTEDGALQFVSTLFTVKGQYDPGTGFVDSPDLIGNSNPTPNPPISVPVPASAALLIPGMLGMVALRRRRTSAVA
jgi:hypothetical protein